MARSSGTLGPEFAALAVLYQVSLGRADCRNYRLPMGFASSPLGLLTESATVNLPQRPHVVPRPKDTRPPPPSALSLEGGHFLRQT